MKHNSINLKLVRLISSVLSVLMIMNTSIPVYAESVLIPDSHDARIPAVQPEQVQPSVPDVAPKDFMNQGALSPVESKPAYSKGTITQTAGDFQNSDLRDSLHFPEVSGILSSGYGMISSTKQKITLTNGPDSKELVSLDLENGVFAITSESGETAIRIDLNDMANFKNMVRGMRDILPFYLKDQDSGNVLLTQYQDVLDAVLNDADRFADKVKNMVHLTASSAISADAMSKPLEFAKDVTPPAEVSGPVNPVVSEPTPVVETVIFENTVSNPIQETQVEVPAIVETRDVSPAVEVVEAMEAAVAAVVEAPAPVKVEIPVVSDSVVGSDPARVDTQVEVPVAPKPTATTVAGDMQGSDLRAALKFPVVSGISSPGYGKVSSTERKLTFTNGEDTNSLVTFDLDTGVAEMTDDAGQVVFHADMNAAASLKGILETMRNTVPGYLKNQDPNHALLTQYQAVLDALIADAARFENRLKNIVAVTASPAPEVAAPAPEVAAPVIIEEIKKEEPQVEVAASENVEAKNIEPAAEQPVVVQKTEEIEMPVKIEVPVISDSVVGSDPVRVDTQVEVPVAPKPTATTVAGDMQGSDLRAALKFPVVSGISSPGYGKVSSTERKLTFTNGEDTNSLVTFDLDTGVAEMTDDAGQVVFHADMNAASSLKGILETMRNTVPGYLKNQDPNHELLTQYQAVLDALIADAARFENRLKNIVAVTASPAPEVAAPAPEVVAPVIVEEIKKEESQAEVAASENVEAKNIEPAAEQPVVVQKTEEIEMPVKIEVPVISDSIVGSDPVRAEIPVDHTASSKGTAVTVAGDMESSDLRATLEFPEVESISNPDYGTISSTEDKLTLTNGPDSKELVAIDLNQGTFTITAESGEVIAESNLRNPEEFKTNLSSVRNFLPLYLKNQDPGNVMLARYQQVIDQLISDADRFEAKLKKLKKLTAFSTVP